MNCPCGHAVNIHLAWGCNYHDGDELCDCAREPSSFFLPLTAIDIVLEVYRDAFGVRSDRANDTHRDACIEVDHLRTQAARIAELEAIVVAAQNLSNAYSSDGSTNRQKKAWAELRALQKGGAS